MTDEEKLSALEEIMELDAGTLKPDMLLKDIEEWDSLAALSYVVLMGDEFDRSVSGKEIRAFKTIKDIMETMKAE